MAIHARGGGRATTPTRVAGDPFRSGYGAGGARGQKRAGESCFCRRAVRLLKRLGGGVVEALRCANGRSSPSSQMSPKSAASSAQYPPPRDSHHAEAIEDCIRFINSNSRKVS